MNELEAYFLGAHLGDGCAKRYRFNCPSSSGVSWQFTLNCIDKDVVDKVAFCIRDLFGLPAKVRFCNRYYSVYCHRKSLVQWLQEITEDRKSLPSDLGNSNDLVKREFIAGLMDTDGWIAENKATRWHKIHKNQCWYQMGIASTSPWIPDLRKFFQSNGVKCGKITEQPRSNQDWAPCFRMYLNLKSFCRSDFYFYTKRKQDRLLRYQKQVLGWDIRDTSSETTRHATRSSNRVEDIVPSNVKALG